MSVLASPLGPMGLLLGGGVLLLAIQGYLSPRWRQWLPLAVVLVAMTAWLGLRWQPAGMGRWWLWRAPLGLETALGLQWDGWSWLAGWLAFMAGVSALVLPGWPTRPGFLPSRFWIPWLLAAVLLVMTSATWTTLLAGWVLLLFFTGILAGTPAEAAPRAWTLLLLSGLLLLLAPLFNGLGTLDLLLSASPLNLQAQLLLSLAGVIIAGVYPFHVWLVSRSRRGSGPRLALHLVPALAAIHLLSRFQLPLLSSFSWIALGIAGLLGSAITAWATDDEDRIRVYVALNRVAWVMLAFALSREQGAYRGIFPLVSLAIGLMVWELSSIWDSRARTSMALFFLMGFPLTPGFPLTRNLAQLAATTLGFPGWLLILLAQTLFVAAVLRPSTSEASFEKQVSPPLARAIAFALMFVIAFGAWWGINPARLLRTAGLAPEGMVMNVFVQIRVSGVIAGWLTLLLPLLLGWLLARWRDRIFTGQENWLTRIASVADLDWLARLLQAGFHYLALALGYASDILDGAGQFGWALLLLLILWLFFR